MKKPLESGSVYKAKMVRLLLMAALLAGCSQAAERDARADRKAARQAAAKEAAAQPPHRTVYRFENGELLVLDIATIGPGGYADSQQCFVWRDTQIGSVSMQCPADALANVPAEHAEVEINQR